ncbi:MAG: hypothetical protein OJF49_001255 [Ktedonobacterales bacterium]|nr:MAG: hypothetical protein OJF49_001255 [Ktedonobacterales bacterium]
MGTVEDSGNIPSDAGKIEPEPFRAPRGSATWRPGQRRARRASLALAISRLEREHVALLTAMCELEAPQHHGDANTRALRAALLPMLREDLRQTQHALTRVARGVYGICEVCRRPLSARHLELKPAATACPHCEGRATRIRD